MTEPFGQRLAQAIANSGMTQGQLAERIGARTELLSRWKSLDAAPRSVYLEQAARALDVNARWLATGAGTPADATAPDGGAVEPEPAPSREEFAALSSRVAELERAIRETNRARDAGVDELGAISDEVDGDHES